VSGTWSSPWEEGMMVLAIELCFCICNVQIFALMKVLLLLSITHMLVEFDQHERLVLELLEIE
jgi:hypothetical protein